MIMLSRTTLTGRGQPCPTVNLPAFSKLSNNKYLPFSVKKFSLSWQRIYIAYVSTTLKEIKSQIFPKEANHYYNFIDCDWFKKLLFPTNSTAIIAQFVIGQFNKPITYKVVV